MRKRDIKIAERFKELVSRRVKVREIRVFGSRARGTASPGSDLDVLVVVDHIDRSIEKYISECAWEAGFGDDIVVVPVVISRDALKKSPLRKSAFIRNVYREGVTV